MIPKNTKYIIKEFRENRGQINMASTPPEPKKRQNKKGGYSPYESFIRKYNNLEECIDKLGTRDLVYYFREIANEQGYKYVISNIKKDMAIMKRLRENFDNREICGMIEFLYESEQDYLEKDRLSPNLLASSWVNTIYADMKLWVDDKYVSKSVKNSNKKVRKGEWKSSSNEKTSIDIDF